MLDSSKIRSYTALVLIGTLTSCSIFSSDSSRLFSILDYLNPKQNSTDSIEPDEQIKWKLTPHNKDILQISNQRLTSTYFATGVEKCGFAQKVNPLATTRQLFVGFEKLNIINQSTIILSGINVARTFVTSTFNNTKVAPIVYSLQYRDCIKDVVFWTISPSDPALAPSMEEIVQNAKLDIELLDLWVNRYVIKPIEQTQRDAQKESGR